MFSKTSNIAFVIMVLDSMAVIAEFAVRGHISNVYDISLSISMAAFLIVKAIEKGKQ